MSSTLLSAWTATVALQPEAVAVIDAATGKSSTRAEIDLSAEQWRTEYGAGLRGQPVLMSEPNGWEWFRVFLGLLKAGATVVPLDPGEPLAAQRALAEALRVKWVWSGAARHAVPVRTTRRWRDCVVVKLTSGSTGTPRALAFTDEQMLADGRQVCAGMDIRPEDVNFGLIPFGHSYGLGNIVVPWLAQGTAVVCGVSALPHPIAESIARWRPTVFPAVPALLRALVMADVQPEQLSSLRTVISAGSPLSAEVASAFGQKFGRNVHSFYGSSETGGITYDRSGDAALTARSVGTPLPGVRLTFGRGGRFTVASAAVFTHGNRRRGTQGDGVHAPADLGVLNAEGELVLQGRTGRFVKIAGRRLDLGEVEQALKALPGVRDALVATHSGRVDALAAAVAGDVSGNELRTALRERLASWKIPKRIVVLPVFPLTARGKVDTGHLRTMLAQE